MPLDPSQVAAAFSALLDRSPDSSQVVENNLHHDTIGDYIRKVVLSPEFLGRLTTAMRRQTLQDLRPLDEERIVFLHIPKCGGTTLHDLLSTWFGASALHLERHNQLYFYAAGDLASKTLFSGHFDYYSTQLIPGRKTLVSFLRDPRQRLISLYHFHRAHRPEVIAKQNLQLAKWANELDIDAYFADPKIRAHPAINNAIARYMSNCPQLSIAPTAAFAPVTVADLAQQAMANLANFTFIGFMDDYDASLARLADLLGKPRPEQVKKLQVLDDLMETNPGMHRIEKQQPSAETLNSLDDLVCHDYLVYREAHRLFDPDCEMPVP